MRSCLPSPAAPFPPVSKLAEVIAAVKLDALTTRIGLSLSAQSTPRLGSGAVHEWFDVGQLPQSGGSRRAAGSWLPSVSLLIDMAWRTIAGDPTDGDGPPQAGGMVMWIGRRCWAYPHALIRRDPLDPTPGGGDRRLLERSVFVDPPGRGERVWSMDLALRCPGVAVVIADGSGLTMSESRRLQLAAASGGAIALLARPAWERRELSAASTRWAVEPAVSSTREQTWTAELLRCKGVQPSPGDPRRWVVRRDYATGTTGEWAACDVGVAGDVVDRFAQTARSKIA